MPGALGRAALAARVYLSYLRVARGRRRRGLPELVAELARPPRRPAPARPAQSLSWAVHRCLHMGGRGPTCLVRSLVLLRLLRAQGQDAELVIGLPAEASGPEAHAWVELDRCCVGPPPGQNGHAEMARYR